MLERTPLVSEDCNLLRMYLRLISNISIAHERIVTQKLINKAFRI